MNAPKLDMSDVITLHSFTGAMYGTLTEGITTDYGSVNVMGSPLFAGKATSAAEERLKRRLRFFFLNPIQKWAATRRFPFKLFIQIIKIIFVTVQASCTFSPSM